MIDISVILPVYNREDFIANSIESALNQDCVAVEIIVIDDGSTDNTLEICNSLARQHRNIRVVHQKNKGLASARNMGLNMATGKYITFLDSDDSIPQNVFYEMLVAMRHSIADVVIGAYEVVSEDAELLGKGEIAAGFSNKLINANDFWQLNSTKQYNYLFTVVWGKLYKREIWDDLRFGEGIRFAEDEYILPELTERCKGYYLFDKVVYRQISSQGSLSRSSFSYIKLNSPESKLKTCEYLIQKGLYECAVEKWGIAVGEIILMTKLAGDDASRKKVIHLQKESIALGKIIFRHMEFKKKCKYVAYRIGYPVFQFVYSK